MSSGFIPTRTTVQASNGGSIPAANGAAAGVMTAEQARQLDVLWSLHQQGGQGAVVFAASEPARPAQDFAPIMGAMVQIGQRLARLESVPQPLAIAGPAAPCGDLETDARVATLAQAIESCAAGLMSATQEQMALASRVAELERILAVLGAQAERIVAC